MGEALCQFHPRRRWLFASSSDTKLLPQKRSLQAHLPARVDASSELVSGSVLLPGRTADCRNVRKVAAMRVARIFQEPQRRMRIWPLESARQYVQVAHCTRKINRVSAIKRTKRHFGESTPGSSNDILLKQNTGTLPEHIAAYRGRAR